MTDERPPGGARALAVLARLARIATEGHELRPLLQRVTDALADSFAWEFVALVRVDRAARRFVCEACTSRVPTEVHPGYSRPFGSGVVGHVAATGTSLLLDDTTAFPEFVDTLHGARSELCVPIRHRNEVVAVLNLESLRPAAFRGELPLVEAIAGQIAGAIANARSVEELRERAETFALLSSVSRAALAATDLDEVLHGIAEFLQRRFDLYLVAIVVAEEGGREWAHRAFAMRDPARLELPARWPVDRGVVGRAMRTGETQLVTDVAADPDYFAVDPRVVAELVAPIRCEGRALGAINLESDRGDAFTPELRELLGLVAEQVAGAIRFALVNDSLAEAMRQLARANAELEQLSYLDPLTGLANRRRFDAALEVEWRRQIRARRPLALVLIDLDAFKIYNDTRGHPAGDELLRRIGALLGGKVRRAGDLAARYGGEEFAVLLHDADEASARAVAEQIRADLHSLALPHPASPVAPVVTASFGIAACRPARGASAASLLADADAALYAAKRGGRDRVESARETSD